MGAFVLLNGHSGYVHTERFCSHKKFDFAAIFVTSEAVPRRFWKWSVTYRIDSVLHFGEVWTRFRAVVEVNKKERGLEFTEAEV